MGIKNKDKKRLFKLYSSIKSNNVNQKGIGLGLVISKMIVQKFNGIINFVSKWKKGSTFFFTFEIEPYNSGDEAKVESNTSQPVAETIEVMLSDARILIADDDEFCLSYMKAIF